MATTLRSTDILFNDSTTQSTAFTGFPTTNGAVGTYVLAFYNLAHSSSLAIGTTVAGSTLYRATDPGNGSETMISAVGTGTLTSQFELYTTAYFGATSLSLSGTWRNMTFIKNNSGLGNSYYFMGLFVRVS
jgi:hypothetical protein